MPSVGGVRSGRQGPQCCLLNQAFTPASWHQVLLQGIMHVPPTHIINIAYAITKGTIKIVAIIVIATPKQRPKHCTEHRESSGSKGVVVKALY